MATKKFGQKTFSPPLLILVGSGIRDGRNQDLGSGTKISDPQHCFSPILTTLTVNTMTGTASFPCVEDAGIEKPSTVKYFFLIWIRRYVNQNLPIRILLVIFVAIFFKAWSLH
jgi:hypothetical protein